tara:strand:- start:10445 stop:12310 length:1866 start_codon:yes stop_codon:yes gene_type:complete
MVVFGVIILLRNSNSQKYSFLALQTRIIFSLISLYPLCFSLTLFQETEQFFSGYAVSSLGGFAGANFYNLLPNGAPLLFLCILSFLIFLLMQFFIFYNVLTLEKVGVVKTVKKNNLTKPTVKKVEKTEVKKETIQKQLLPDQENKREINFLDYLDKNTDESTDVSNEYLINLSENLEEKLLEFNIEGKVLDNMPGPVVTRFEVDLAPGTKVNQVTNIASDLARSLAVKSVRVVEVIEGKSTIGIEIPNPKRKLVTLHSILEETNLESLKPLEFCIGMDIQGNLAKINLQQLPHLLIAGTTGSGKSVGVNTIILNLLRKNHPKDLRLLLIDPKMLELSVYDDIPHLITPVITDMQKAANGLNWCVKEMDKRYKLMSILGARSLESYNQKIKNLNKIESTKIDELNEVAEGDIEQLPYIVVVIDELADLMMVTGKKVEQLIARLAQKARASGIHLVIATQRPSVDVITGLIKANIPSRMAFLVSSKVDSRTILDQGGAEQLLGKGDMLFLEPGTSIPVRIHGSFVNDDEVQKIAKSLRDNGKPDYVQDVTKSLEAVQNNSESNEDDDLYDQAVEFVVESRRASISSIQRKFRIGYNRAARLIETMEENGIVSPMNSNGSREVL